MKNILMIDDDRDMADIVSYMLDKEPDLKFIAAFGASEAIGLVKSQKIDLMLIDIMMPEVNGGEALGIIKKIPGMEKVPAIFFTGLLSDNDLRKNLKISVDGKEYEGLAKPVQRQELLRKIRDLLRSTS